MSTDTNSRPILKGVVLVWLSASLLEGTVLAAQERVPVVFALLSAAIHFAWLGVLAIPVWRVCWKLGEAPRSRTLLTAVHGAMGMVVLTLWVGGYLGFLYVVTQGEILLAMREATLWQAFGAVFTYILLVVGILAAQSSLRLTAQRERERDLLLLAKQAEVKALKAQLHPHFLFNTLNSIYALIELCPSDAQDMVGRLGELLRKTLEAAEERYVPLSWELELVDAYLAIEKIRLGDRLSAHVDVDGVDLNTPVLPFVLQPLVENAIKHGIACRSEPGEVRVRVRQRGAELEISVDDSGPGWNPAPSTPDSGRGIQLTRRRLENAYGSDAFQMEFSSLSPRGTGVLLRFGAAS